MYSDYYDSIGKVAETDKEVADAMALELKRQRDNIELIASENLVSPQVMAAMGSVLTNKYAEGLPAKRYYGGCQYVDIVENIAIKRACELFKCNFANVQPHSGAQANTAVYLALLKPGDTVMGMSLITAVSLLTVHLLISAVSISTLYLTVLMKTDLLITRNLQSKLIKLNLNLWLQVLPLIQEKLILKQWLILHTQTVQCLW